MNRCPECFTPTDTIEAAFVCVGSCPPERDDDASLVRGLDISAKPAIDVAPPLEERRRRRPTSAVCPECGTRSERECCRRCHHPFPPGWRDLDTTCIVTAGARTSGKSVYIAVLVHQLRLMARRSQRTFEAADDTTAQEYARRYEDPLFGSNRVMDSTRPADQGSRTSLPVPLVFRLDSRNGRGRGHMLVVRDLPGENLEGPLDPDVFGVCAQADSILFLIDPFQVRIIREMLVEVIPEQLKIGADARLVLSNFTRLLRHTWPTGPIGVPMAVVISKFDALQQLREVDDDQWGPIMKHVGATFQRDPDPYRPLFNQQDADLLEAEVRSLLHLLRADELLTQLDSNYLDTRLFAVSALGHAPAGESLHSSGIAPFRVLDPLKWLLARAGVLDARAGD